jgi:integrase
VRFQGLRHTCATLLLSRRATTQSQEGNHPKVVPELLGHATIAITLDTYGRVVPNMQEIGGEGDGQFWSSPQTRQGGS